MVEFPPFVPTFHHEPYPAIDPTKADLSTKTVLLTGGGSGIGRAICHAFSKARVKNLIILDRNQKALFDVRDELMNAYGGRTSFSTFVANVTDSTLLREIFENIHSTIGDIDILVNNAAYQPLRVTYTESDPDDWWRGFEINTRGSYNLTTAFLRYAKPGATLINLSSVLAHWSNTEGYLVGQSSYSGSKIAITRAMEILQRERSDIRVINVHPGLVATEMASRSGTTKVSKDNGKKNDCLVLHQMATD
jgi:NAD(P)-dependent dehydrogenase (short-subunit alcohol dehydrogenase family)